MDGWNTSFILGFGLFSGAILKKKRESRQERKTSLLNFDESGLFFFEIKTPGILEVLKSTI